MPLVTAQELIDAGVHYGHQASRWNPKMKPFIHGKRHKIHVINLEETIRGLYRATHFLRHVAATGAQIMFLHQEADPSGGRSRGEEVHHAARHGALDRRHADQLRHRA